MISEKNTWSLIGKGRLSRQLEPAEDRRTELLEDILEGGVFGDSSMSRKHSSNITLQAVSESKRGKKAKASVLQSLFPDRRYMERNYSYLKKHRFLLPVAYLSRIGKYLKENEAEQRELRKSKH